MDVTFDRDADAIYVTLAALPFVRNESLDFCRSIDYGADDTVIGVEFLCVSEGVDLADIPYASEIRLEVDQYLKSRYHLDLNWQTTPKEPVAPVSW